MELTEWSIMSIHILVNIFNEIGKHVIVKSVDFVLHYRYMDIIMRGSDGIGTQLKNYAVLTKEMSFIIQI